MITEEQKEQIAQAAIDYAVSNGWVGDKTTGVNQIPVYQGERCIYITYHAHGFHLSRL